MGRKSPLHDRQTSSLEIKPFDYLDSSLFFPDYSKEEKCLVYGILGGIPRYLEAFDPKQSIEKNIANGRNKIIDISNFIHEDRTKVAKYLITLQTLRLIEKRIPCGEPETSKKSIYVIRDNFFKFWFRYEFTNNAYYTMLGAKDAAKENFLLFHII